LINTKWNKLKWEKTILFISNSSLHSLFPTPLGHYILCLSWISSIIWTIRFYDEKLCILILDYEFRSIISVFIQNNITFLIVPISICIFPFIFYGVSGITRWFLNLVILGPLFFSSRTSRFSLLFIIALLPNPLGLPL